MRILQLEDESWDSGLAHYALSLSAELARRGHEVHLWGRPDSWILERAASSGVRTRSYEKPWVSLRSLREEFRQIGFDLINAHTGSSHTFGLALSAGTRTPLVRTRGDARPSARHFLARALAKRTRAFIAANSDIRGSLRASFPGARVDMIFQGIEFPGPEPLAPDPVVGILGRLDPIKGHLDYLEAAAEIRRTFPKARFLVAGKEVKPDWRMALKSTAARLGLDDCVEFLGEVPDASEFMKRCRIGVVASRGSEAVSRAALEWMAMGRPVVATAVGGLPDFIEHQETGLIIPPSDAGALAAAVNGLLLAAETAETMGSKARHRFERLFTLNPFGDATENLYRELIAEGRGQGRSPSHSDQSWEGTVQQSWTSDPDAPGKGVGGQG